MRKYIGKAGTESIEKRYRRKLSIRSRLSGSTERPRVCATKSNKHIYVQVIDDSKEMTILSAQTFGKRAVQDSGNNLAGAKVLGEHVATELKKKNLTSVVFDRAGYKYTGVIAAFVDALREKGIQV